MKNTTANYLVPALTAFTTAMVTKGADGPARTLNLLWEYVFGKWNDALGKEINAKTSVKDYGNKIAQETEKIPKEFINQNPDISILGAALEASKFYTEKEEIRNIFAKVIGASFDTRKADDVHYAFIAIIKQMNPLDASNLALFKDKPKTSLPTAKYILREKKQGASKTIISNVFLANKKYDFSEKMAVSLSNLFRLGLINITYASQIADDLQYEDFYKHHIYLSLKEGLEHDAEGSKKCDLGFERGLIHLTPLGRNFVKICF